MSASMAEEIAGVLAAHVVEYREWYVEDGWNMIYKSICRTCGELPEGPNEADHQAAVLAAAGYGKLEEARTEIEELQEFQNSIASRIPDRYEDDVAQEAIIDRWLDDITSNVREARAQALEDAADAITWVKPEKSPCESFEACCGSEASCDAMRPSTSAVGEHWLRARAVTERGQA